MSQTGTTASTPITWVSDPAFRCVKYIAEETIHAATLQRAIIALSHQDWLLKCAREKVIKERKPVALINSLIEQQKYLGKWARDIVSGDYEGINKHGVVGIWVAIEVAVEDTAVGVLINYPGIAQSVANAGVKIPSNLPSVLSENDARRIYNRIERALRQDKSVVDGYTAVLASVDIQMTVPSQAIPIIDEFNYVRNCFLHRGGIVDERVNAEAPDLKLTPGEKLKISSGAFLRYFDAAGEFAKALLHATKSSSYAQ